jgi:hypothetical protein
LLVVVVSLANVCADAVDELGWNDSLRVEAAAGGRDAASRGDRANIGAPFRP